MALEDDVNIIINADANKAFAEFQRLNTFLHKTAGLMKKQALPAITAIRQQFKGMADQIIRDQSSQKAYWENYMANVKGATKLTTGLGGTFQEMKRQFAGWALSIMFFGMAMKRVFDTIWKEGTKTFQDIMHSVEGSVTQFDMLNGSMTYMKFVAGQALEPIAAFLIPWIDKISDLITKHDKLFAGIVVVGGVLGGLFMAGGMGVLALNGFLELGGKIKGVLRATDNLKNFDWAGLGSTIQKGIGVVSIMVAVKLAKDAIDAWNNGEVFKSALKGVSSVAFGAGGIMLLKGNGYGGALIAAGVALDLVSENKFFQTVGSVINLLSALFATFADYMMNVFRAKLTIGIIEGLVNGVNAAIDRIPEVVKDYLGISGVRLNVSRITQPLKKSIDEFNFIDKYAGYYVEGQAMMKDWDLFMADKIRNAEFRTGEFARNGDGTVNNEININVEGNMDEKAVDVITDYFNQSNIPI